MSKTWLRAKRGDKNLLIECACGCVNIRHLFDHKRRIHLYISGHNATGKRSGNWKGGRTKKNKYWYVWKPEHHFCDAAGYVLEHRLVYEDHYRCVLLPWAAVHHVDANTENNTIENLQTMMHSKHSILENRKGIRATIFCKGNIPWNKGKTGFIPWNKGKPWPEEIRNKISLAKKGHVAWNKGLKKK